MKDEFLRLLEEDREFRYAIMGLLGIVDLRNAVSDLVSAVRALTEEVKGVRADVNELKSGFSSLENRVSKIETRIGSIETRIGSLEARLDKVEARLDGVEGRLDKVEGRLDRIEESLDRIDRTMERVIMSLEEEANYVVQHYLGQRGIVVKTGPTYLDARYEFDIYGTNGRVTVVGEAKVRAGPDTVREVNDRVNEAIKQFPDKFPGTIVKVLYCMRALPGTVEEANRLGIWLIESAR